MFTNNTTVIIEELPCLVNCTFEFGKKKKCCKKYKKAGKIQCKKCPKIFA